jgi:hypothetical protein
LPHRQAVADVQLDEMPIPLVTTVDALAAIPRPMNTVLISLTMELSDDAMAIAPRIITTMEIAYSHGPLMVLEIPHTRFVSEAKYDVLLLLVVLVCASATGTIAITAPNHQCVTDRGEVEVLSFALRKPLPKLRMSLGHFCFLHGLKHSVEDVVVILESPDFDDF